jgi:hypothetical protein
LKGLNILKAAGLAVPDPVGRLSGVRVIEALAPSRHSICVC